MKTIEYFFECYFNMSADYSEIEQLVIEFKEIEIDKYLVALENELSDAIVKERWDRISRIALEKGGRVIKNSKSEVLTRYLLDLVKGKTVIAKPDFYNL